MKQAGARLGGLLAAGIAAAGLVPATAGAHGIVTREGGTLAFRATDFVSQNNILVTQSADYISILDDRGAGGIDPGDCRPGRVALSTGYVIEALCARAGVTRLRINTGEREDDVEVRSSLPTTVIGGGGIDIVRTGAGDDEIRSGSGADRIDPGPGRDVVEAGEGDDVLRLEDGQADQARCGEGRDFVVFDAPLDRIADDCESMPLRPLADNDAPRIRVSAAARQRWSGRLVVRAAADEQARFVVRDQALALRPGRGKVDSDVGAAELRPRMNARVRGAVRRALARGDRVRLFVTVVATDATGNSSVRNVRPITLR
jgi:hypothetical protein